MSLAEIHAGRPARSTVPAPPHRMSLASCLLLPLAYSTASMPASAVDVIDANANALVVLDDLDGDGKREWALAARGRPGCKYAQLDYPEGPSVGVWIVSGTGQPLRYLEAPTAVLCALPDVDGDGLGELAAAGGGRVEIWSPRSGESLGSLTPGADRPLPKDWGRGLALGSWSGAAAPDLAVGARGGVWIFPVGQFEPTLAVSLADDEPRWVRPDARELSPEASRRSPKRQSTWGDVQAGVVLAPFPDVDGDGRDELLLGGQWRNSERLHPSMLNTGELPTEADSGAGVFPKGLGAQQLLLSRSGERRILPFHSTAVLPLPAGRGDDARHVVVSAREAEFMRAVDAGTGAVLWEQDWTVAYLHGEGAHLELLGDWNGDGTDDVLVTANESGIDCDRGWVAVFSGATGEVLLQRFTDPADPDLEVPGLHGGYSACAIEDLTGDGLPEVRVYSPVFQEFAILNSEDFAVLRFASARDWRAPQALWDLREAVPEAEDSGR